MEAPSSRAYHPASMIFPLMDDSAIEELAEDIRRHGQRVKIVLHQDGRIIDGRNRQTACLLAGVAPQYETCPETDEQKIAELVWSLNEERRHMDPAQRNAAALNMEEFIEQCKREAKERQKAQGTRGAEGGRGKKKPCGSKEPQGSSRHPTRDKVAKVTKTSPAQVARTKAVKEKAPDLFKQMEQGKIKTGAAYNQMQKREKKKQLDEKAAAAKEMMKEEPPWTLINDDVSAGLESIKSHHAPARLIFADPPYNIGVDYGDGAQGDNQPPLHYLSWVGAWLADCVDVLASDGSLWVMICDEYAADYAVELKSLGLTIRSWIKWYETFGVNCANNFNRTSRHIFYCVKDPKRFVFNPDTVTRPSDRQTKYNDKRAADGGKIWDDVWCIPRLTGTCKERLPDFPTQLPLELVRAIVGCASEPGDLVVDPFNGSGTTGMACIELGRRYIGIDHNEKFIDLAHNRLMAASI